MGSNLKPKEFGAIPEKTIDTVAKALSRPSRTKIVVTIGPASSSKEMLKQFIIEGVDVVRLNFSHGDHDGHLKVIEWVRELNRELGVDIAILADLQGPKLRIGAIENNEMELFPGDIISFVSEPCIGNRDRVHMSYANFPKDVNPGELVLVDDGKLRFEVVETNRLDCVKLKALVHGFLSSNKGVNLPDTKISLPSLTVKDRKDAHFALEHEVDWIALSFVRGQKDIIELRDLMAEHKNDAGIIAKIEKPEALEELEEIIGVADGIMVARGDLGVEVPFDRVPVIQKDIIKRCIARSKPVIVATQMMESMITNYTPTRAEANDVANAVLDGADAVMLSAETSIGRYPVQTIRAMQQIIHWTEDNAYQFYQENKSLIKTSVYLADHICFNASQLAKQTSAKAIVCFTYSGYTAFRLSSHRPGANIFALTDSVALVRRLSLLWGVRAILDNENRNIESAIHKSVAFLKEAGIIHDGDVVVHVGSIPQSLKESANTVRLSTV